MGAADGPDRALAATAGLAASGQVAAPDQAAAFGLPAAHAIRLQVNGIDHELQVQPWVTLLDLLRDRLHLTGTKKGCDHGQCGACTVLADGKRINSCLTLAVMRDGAAITTVEGLGDAQGELHPLQQAFIDHDALQCGYCTPGQICSAVALINEGHAKTTAQIRELMSGNICRCGAYPQIVRAISAVMAGGPALPSGGPAASGAPAQSGVGASAGSASPSSRVPAPDVAALAGPGA